MNLGLVTIVELWDRELWFRRKIKTCDPLAKCLEKHSTPCHSTSSFKTTQKNHGVFIGCVCVVCLFLKIGNQLTNKCFREFGVQRPIAHKIAHPIALCVVLRRWIAQPIGSCLPSKPTTCQNCCTTCQKLLTNPPFWEIALLRQCRSRAVSQKGGVCEPFLASSAAILASCGL